MDIRTACHRPVAAFTMVPNRLLRDPSLSPVAKTCLLFAATHEPGWIIRRAHILEAVGISIRTWNRAARELRARGALHTVPAGRGGHATLRGQLLQFDWSEWTTTASEIPAEPAAQDSANRLKVSDLDGRERDPDSDPKGIPNRIPKGSTKKRERKKERAGAREGRSEPPSRRQDVRGSHKSEPAEIGKVLPSLERRREIARELGLDPDRGALCRTSDPAVEPPH